MLHFVKNGLDIRSANFNLKYIFKQQILDEVDIEGIPPSIHTCIHTLDWLHNFADNLITHSVYIRMHNFLYFNWIGKETKYSNTTFNKHT